MWAAAIWSAIPKVRMVSLTGDIVTGQKILQAAAGAPSSTRTLELGGKAAVIVCNDCDDIEAVVEGVRTYR